MTFCLERSWVLLHQILGLLGPPRVGPALWWSQGSRAPADQAEASRQGAACGDASVPGGLRVGRWTPGPALRGFPRASPGVGSLVLQVFE